MKKKKLLSVLTASVLTIGSAIPMFSSALALLPNAQGTPEEVLKEYFGDKAITRYDGYFDNIVISPERMGALSCHAPYLKVKLKKGSEQDLTKILEDNKLNSKVEKNEDGSYTLSYDSKMFTPENSKFMREIRNISKADSCFDDEIKVLTQLDDVVSIDSYWDISVQSTDGEYCNYDAPVITVKNVIEDFDKEKYPEFDYVETEDYKVFRFFSDDSEKMYELYTQLLEDYGEENVSFGFGIVRETVPVMQSVGTNLYTAAITGDVNSDGDMDIADSVTISAYVADSEKNHLNDQQMVNGDIDGNGLDANDALAIQQYIAGVIESL